MDTSDNKEESPGQEDLSQDLDLLNISVSKNTVMPLSMLCNHVIAINPWLKKKLTRSIANSCDIRITIARVCKNPSCANPYHPKDFNNNFNVETHSLTNKATPSQGLPKQPLCSIKWHLNVLSQPETVLALVLIIA